MSKHLKYDFWYNQVKGKYGKNVRLLYKCTNSLLFEAETRNVYEDMRQAAGIYNINDYPTPATPQKRRRLRVSLRMNATADRSRSLYFCDKRCTPSLTPAAPTRKRRRAYARLW
jgi:hypothetical protein